MLTRYNILFSDDTSQITGTATDAIGWGGWAWNMVSSVLPGVWDNDWSNEQEIAYSGHIIHLGVYIDDATLTFKVLYNAFLKKKKKHFASQINWK